MIVVLLGTTFRNTEPFSVPFDNFSRISPLFSAFAVNFVVRARFLPLTRQNRALTTKFTANAEKRGEIREKIVEWHRKRFCVTKRCSPTIKHSQKIFFIQFLKNLDTSWQIAASALLSGIFETFGNLLWKLNYNATCIRYLQDHWLSSASLLRCSPSPICYHF